MPGVPRWPPRHRDCPTWSSARTPRRSGPSGRRPSGPGSSRCPVCSDGCATGCCDRSCWVRRRRRWAPASPSCAPPAVLPRAPLMLVATAEPFEYHHEDWGADIMMIGASSWEPPAEVPAWLDDGDRPLVLVTTSSEFQDDG